MTPVKDSPPHPCSASTYLRCLTCLSPQNALPPGISQDSGEIIGMTRPHSHSIAWLPQLDRSLAVGDPSPDFAQAAKRVGTRIALG
jgi:hypothetical protein